MPQHDLLDYYTEPMKVPFYVAGGDQKLSTLAADENMQVSFFLDPLTEVWAEKKPATQTYIVAHVASGAHKNKWGMIWSGHLRRARHINESILGQTLTGASYGVTRNTLEADTAVGQPSPWRNTVVKVDHPTEGPICQRCNSPVRNHKIYESKQARDYLVEMSNDMKYPGKYMIGLLLVFDGAQSPICIIGAESGWKGRQFQDAFNKRFIASSTEKIWANEHLGLVDGKKPWEMSTDPQVRDWSGRSISMSDTGEAMQCAGPKLIQSYLQWDRETGRNKRATDKLFMSEIWGDKDDAKQNIDDNLATYGSRQSASSCMRCRTEIPPMLCGKAPAISRADMPPLPKQMSHD